MQRNRKYGHNEKTQQSIETDSEMTHMIDLIKIKSAKKSRMLISDSKWTSYVSKSRENCNYAQDDVESMKTYKLWKLKTAISEMKNNPGGINSRLDRAEVEGMDRTKSMQHGIQGEKTPWGKGKRRKLWDNIKWIHICITGVSEEGRQ